LLVGLLVAIGDLRQRGGHAVQEAVEVSVVLVPLALLLVPRLAGLTAPALGQRLHTLHELVEQVVQLLAGALAVLGSSLNDRILHDCLCHGNPLPGSSSSSGSAVMVVGSRQPSSAALIWLMLSALSSSARVYSTPDCCNISPISSRTAVQARAFSSYFCIMLWKAAAPPSPPLCQPCWVCSMLPLSLLISLSICCLISSTLECAFENSSGVPVKPPDMRWPPSFERLESSVRPPYCPYDGDSAMTGSRLSPSNRK